MKPKRKSIWICSACGNGHTHTTKESAEECCVCPECGKPNPTSLGGQVYCAECSAIAALERAQEQLESAARNYASVAKNVQGTLKLPYVPTRREIKKALKR